MQKGLIIQNSVETPPGTLTQWLEERHLNYDLILASEVSTWPSPQDYSFLVILGGDMNVDEEHIHPWLKNEKSFIKEFLATNKKILGICLGAQLMAEVMGAQVHKHDQWEVGWHPVQLKNFPPQFQDLNGELLAFHWHGYRFHLPQNATRIGQSVACEDQGFMIGNAAGFQFHPESTTAWVEECARDAQKLIDKHKGQAIAQNFIQSSEQMYEDMTRKQKNQQNWFYRFLDQFLN